MITGRDHEDSGRMRYGGAVLRDDDDHLHKGDVVDGGKYRIDAVLGRGGMATVYSARRERDGLEVAFKLIHEKYAARKDVEYRLRNEVELAAELSGHPNIVRPLDVGRLAECGDVPFVVTELAHGPPLTIMVIQARFFPALRSCRIGLDIARALSALHQHGIVHRDVKPDNVILVNEGTDREIAKLIDFGLAARVRVAHENRARVTEVFERPGTKHYMAPEQATGEPAAFSMDVYALGCTLYEMLLGSPPYGKRSEAEVVARKLATDQPQFSIADECLDLPASVVELVDACLVREPAKRATIEALIRRLEAVIVELGGATAPSEDAAGAVSSMTAALAMRTTGREAMVATSGAERRVDDSRRDSNVRGRAVLWVSGAVFAVAATLAIWWIGRDSGVDENRDAQARERSVISEDAARPSTVDPLMVGTPPVDEPPTAVVEGPAPAPQPNPEPAPPEPKPPASTPKPQTAREAKNNAATPAPREPPKDDPACAALRDEVAQDVRALEWTLVLEKTQTRRCWPNAAERLHARVDALLALGRHEQCVREGKASSDRRIVRLTELCRRRLDTP